MAICYNLTGSHFFGEGYTLSNNNFTQFTPAYPFPPIEKYTHLTREDEYGICLESDHSRQFYIDSNYHIFLYSEMMSEGEGGKPDIDGGPVEEVTINAKGGFTTKSVKKSRRIS